MSDQCTEERFLRDVANHEMTIIRDDGVNRHIRFKNPGTIAYYFDLITWPGNLLVTGDCGTYVFNRTHDMFEFFGKNGYGSMSKGRRLYINTSYWAEKVTAECRHGRIQEFSEDKFRAAIKTYFDEHFAEEVNNEEQERSDASSEFPLSPDLIEKFATEKEKRDEIWEAIEDEIFSYIDYGNEATRCAYDFKHEDFEFVDFFENNFDQYTFHFIWNLYAIAYGIEQYNLKIKTEPLLEVEPK